MDTLFLAFLAQHDDEAWFRIADRLERACHPVDRVALRIWFRFYPLVLQRAMEASDAPAALATTLRLDGRWRLADQIDDSHAFFYGHRYWPAVKTAVLGYVNRPVAPGSLDLAMQIQAIAAAAADGLAPVAELVAITAVAVRTLQQVGPDAFAATRPEPAPALAADADALLAARARDDRQGLFGRFKGDRRRWTVTFRAGAVDDRFPLIHSQHLTTAAGMDARDHRSRDPRCTEGPIPVQCRSCSCGTCWVGVLGGAEKLSPVEERERAKLAACGYDTSTETHPVIRLACMAQAYGAIAIVIPPWNGQIGSLFRKASTWSSTGPR